MKEQEKISIKYKMPVSRVINGMAVFFLAFMVFWIVVIDIILIDVVMTDLIFFLIFGIGMPFICFLIFLLAVKVILSNYHEITNRKLVISIPPRRISIPLEEIIEVKSDVGLIKTDFGEFDWNVEFEVYEPGEYYFDGIEVKYEEEYSKKGRSFGKYVAYGTSVSHSGGVTRYQSVFSKNNLILIRAKNKEIVTNVPDVKEFVTKTLEAIQRRKSILKQRPLIYRRT